MATWLEQNPALATLSHRLKEARDKGTLCLQAGDLGCASAPSNIALLKYWGKSESVAQVPVNSSLSLTLDSFRATTQVEVIGRFSPTSEALQAVERPEFVFRLNDHERPLPEKMSRFLQQILLGFADDIALRITSYNNFPTACGVASSAAGYAALVGSIADLLNLEKHFDSNELTLWLAEWARLGSGSATRSAVPVSGGVSGQFVAWELMSDQMTTKSYQVPAASGLAQLQHCVLVLDDSEKAIGSSEGHALAKTSPFQPLRLAQFPLRLEQMKRALQSDDVSIVASLTECDAYEMHTVMATGKTPLWYMSVDTVEALSRFVRRRNDLRLKMFWTLDAGANPHLIFEHSAHDGLADFFEELASLARFKNGYVLSGTNTGCGLVLGRNAGAPTRGGSLSEPLKLSLTEAVSHFRKGCAIC